MLDSLFGLTFPIESWKPFGPTGLELAPFGFLVGIGIVLGTIIAGAALARWACPNASSRTSPCGP